MESATNPYQYFINHPVNYALSVAGAAGGATYAALHARRGSSTRRRVGFLLLAAMCALQCSLIIAGTERARRRVTREPADQALAA